MSKRNHRPLLASETAFIKEVGSAIKTYKKSNVAAFVEEREARIRDNHLVPHWQRLLDEDADSGADQVRSAVLAWMFKGQPEGKKELVVDELCTLVKKRIGTLRLIPQKTSVAVRAKGLDMCGNAMIKPWTDSLSVRKHFRPSLEELTRAINVERSELFQLPASFKKTASLCLGSVFSVAPYDITVHDDCEAALDFAEALIDLLEDQCSEEKTKKVSKEQLFESIAQWCLRGEGRNLIEALSFSTQEVAVAIKASASLDVLNDDSIVNLYEARDFIDDAVAANDIPETIGDTDEADLDSGPEDAEVFEVEVEREDCEPAIEVEDIASVGVETEATDDPDLVPAEDGIILDLEGINAGNDSCESESDEFQHIRALRSLRYPEDKEKCDVIMNILSDPKRNISFTKGFFRATLAQIDLVLAHPKNYSVAQVRVLSEIMTCLYDKYIVTSTEKLNLTKINSAMFTENIIKGILSRVRESGPRDPEMKEAQVKIDLIGEELRSLRMLKDLLESAKADPQTQGGIAQRLLATLQDELERVNSTVEIERQIEALEADRTPVESELLEKQAVLDSLENQVNELLAAASTAAGAGDIDSMMEKGAEAKNTKEEIAKLQLVIDELESKNDECLAQITELKSQMGNSSGRAELIERQIEAAERQVQTTQEVLTRLDALNQTLTDREEVLQTTLEQVNLQMQAINEMLATTLEGMVDIQSLEQSIKQA